MKKELLFIQQQLIETYNGDPWYGRSLLSILQEVGAFKAWGAQVKNNHNNTVLLNHLINWRLFAISRFEVDSPDNSAFFEKHNFKMIIAPSAIDWQHALDRLARTQQHLLEHLDNKTDEILDRPVAEQQYNFRVLLHGIIQHDVYHIGQMMLSIK